MAESRGPSRPQCFFIGFCVLFMAAFVGILSGALGVDVFLSIVLGSCFLMLVATNAYFVAKWVDPADLNDGVALTALVIFALTIAEGAILGLPLDVANNQAIGCYAGTATDVCGGMDMYIYWQVIGMMIFLLNFFFIPMAIFFYEAYDAPEIRKRRKKGNDNRKAFMEAACYEFVLLAVVFGTLIIMYTLLGKSKVPVTLHKASLDLMTDTAWVADPDTTSASTYFTAILTSDERVNANSVKPKETWLILTCSFAVYTVALTGFAGWFCFVFFGGIGLAAVPITLINNFIDRPKVMKPADIAREKMRLKDRTAELIKIGYDMKTERASLGAKKQGFFEKKKQRREDRTNVNQLKQMVYMLENELNNLLVCESSVDGFRNNQMLMAASLVAGVIAAIISFIWILHMALYMLPDTPIDPFLNKYFLLLEDNVSLLGVLSVTLWSGYLALCVVGGLFKVGVRFFCISLHPMRYGKTLMNSMLFNVSVLVLCSLPVVQFCTYAFDAYARYTTISTLLGVQVKYMEFLSLFFETKAFVYIILILSGVSTMYLGYYHRDESADKKKLESKVKKRGR